MSDKTKKRRNTPRLPTVYTTAEILSLLQAEGTNPYDEEWLNNRNKEQAKSW